MSKFACFYFLVLWMSVAATGCTGSGPSNADGGSSCQGSPSSCSSQTDQLDCIDVYGCDWEESCTGVSDSCTGRGEFTCDLQEGCSWDSSSEECSGIADSCGELTYEGDCIGQDGCTWNEGCGGTARPCSESTVDAYFCELQPGCYWAE